MTPKRRAINLSWFFKSNICLFVCFLLLLLFFVSSPNVSWFTRAGNLVFLDKQFVFSDLSAVSSKQASSCRCQFVENCTK